MGTINENPPIAWTLITASSAVVGVLWFAAWRTSPWPLVGYIGGGLVLAVPVVLGIVAGVKKRRMNKT